MKSTLFFQGLLFDSYLVYHSLLEAMAFECAPTKEVFVTKFSVARKRKKQHKLGTAIGHTPVIPEESGGQATPLFTA